MIDEINPVLIMKEIFENETQIETRNKNLELFFWLIYIKTFQKTYKD